MWPESCFPFLFENVKIETFKVNTDSVHGSFSNRSWVRELDLHAELFISSLELLEVNDVDRPHGDLAPGS